MFRDFKPIVVEECVGTATPHLHEPAIEMISVGWGQVNTLEQTPHGTPRVPGQPASRGGDDGHDRLAVPRRGLRRVHRSVRKAEEAGYSHAWFVDSQILWQDCFVYMTHALAQTERIVVGTAVTNPYTRHVTTIASTFATLAGLHPGRLACGIGRGDSAVRTMGLNPVKTSMLSRVGCGAARADGRPPRRDQRRRRALPLARERSGDPDHDGRDRAQEPARRRRAGRPRDALRRRRASSRCAGRSSTCGRAPRAPVAIRMRSSSRCSRRCGWATTRKTPGSTAAGRPPPARTTSPTPCSRNPRARHARGDDAAAGEPGRLRLLRRAPLVGGRSHRLSDRRADRRLHARRPGRQGAAPRCGSCSRSGSTRSRART